MVILKKIDITTMSKLWMEELKNLKVVYPRTLIAFLTRIVWGTYSPIIELFYKTNTWSPDSIKLTGSPTNLPRLFISKEFPRNIFSLVHAELDENSLILNKQITLWLVSRLNLFVVGEAFPSPWGRWHIGAVLGVWIKQEQYCNEVDHKLCKGNIYLNWIKTTKSL